MAKLHTNPNCEELKKIELLDKQDSPNDTKLTQSTTPEPKDVDETKNSSPIRETTSLLIDQVVVQPAIEATNEAVIVTTPTSTNDKTTGCGGNCFKTGKKCKKRWISSNSDKNTPQMSEVYCPTCDDFANETPACLNKMPDKKSKLKPKTILSVESELVVTKRGSLKFNERKSNITIGRSSSLSAADRRSKKPEVLVIRKDKLKTKEKDKEDKSKELTKDTNKDKIKEQRSAKTSLLAKVSPKKLRNPRNCNSPTDKSKTSLKNKKESINNNGETKANKLSKKPQSLIQQEELKKDSNSDSCQEYEIADDAISLNGCSGDITQVSEGVAKMVILTDNDAMITVRGKEELPVVEQSPNACQLSPIPLSPLTIEDNKSQQTSASTMYQFEKCVRVPVTADSHPLQPEITDLETKLVHNDNNEALVNNDNHSPLTYSPQLKAGLSTVQNRPASLNDCNGNCNNSASCSTSPMSPPSVEADADADGEDLQNASNFASTLPKTKRSAAMQAFYNRAIHLVPKRRTPDGTTIYYWCDLPKNSLKGF